MRLRELVQDDLLKRYSPEQTCRAGCGASSLMTRRCGCLGKRSSNRCTCSREARCAAS
jgi:hypothetical protein